MRAFWAIVRRSLDIWQLHRVSLQAAGLAFYLALSLGPLLIILTAAVGVFVGQSSAESDVLSPLQPLIGEHATGILRGLAAGVERRSSTLLPSALSLALLLVGAAGIFEQLKQTLDGIWEVPLRGRRGIVAALKNRFLSVLLVAACTLVILVLLTTSASMAAIDQSIMQAAPFLGKSLNVAQIVVSFVAVTLIFGVTFKLLPDAAVRWSDVWLGASITSLLFIVGQFCIGLFMVRSGLETTTGRATAMVVLLLWLYYSAQIYLLGAVFTRAYATRASKVES
jgi:membrane protein